MKLHHVMEMSYGDGNPLFVEWRKSVKREHPNAQFTGNDHQCQAVDWSSASNEVAGDWEAATGGVVYKAGSHGKQVIDRVGADTQ